MPEQYNGELLHDLAEFIIAEDLDAKGVAREIGNFTSECIPVAPRLIGFITRKLSAFLIKFVVDKAKDVGGEVFKERIGRLDEHLRRYKWYGKLAGALKDWLQKEKTGARSNKP